MRPVYLITFDTKSFKVTCTNGSAMC